MLVREQTLGSGVDRARVLHKGCVPHEGEVQDRLIEYTRMVLTSLGIKVGPSHFEVMMTTRGPVLIETGARMQGGSLPGLSSKRPATAI